MADLGSFQTAFVGALQGGTACSDDALMTALRGRGVAVHRNTVVKGLIDALADNYPTIERLVGREWFAACAAEYAQQHPPTVPMLALYGAGFADFLASLPTTAEFPYLPDVARIDRLWTEAHFALDAPPLVSSILAQRAPTELFGQRLTRHPAAHFSWFSHSAATIWLRNRPPAPVSVTLEVDGAAEGALLTRPRGTVEYVRLDAAGYAFLTRVCEGATLGAAATAVLETDPTADVASQLAQLIAAGAFASLEHRTAGESQ